MKGVGSGSGAGGGAFRREGRSQDGGDRLPGEEADGREAESSQLGAEDADEEAIGGDQRGQLIEEQTVVAVLGHGALEPGLDKRTPLVRETTVI